MSRSSMEYNSDRSKLIIPEYGRNVQKLIEYAKTLEDSEYRQAFVEAIVDLMQQTQPANQSLEDYRIKLWQHMFKIAQYDIDVQAPVDLDLEKVKDKRPLLVSYPSSKVPFKHYGTNVQKMIDKAIAMEDEEKRIDYTKIIGAYMKLAYKTWNRDTINDETVYRDLESMSNGLLKIENGTSLDNLLSQPTRKRKRTNTSHHSKNGRNHYGNNNKNNRRRK